MLNNISYFLIFGRPLIFYLGITTITLLIIQAVLGYLLHVGKIEFKHHRNVAIILIIVALIHGTLAFLAYL